MSEWDGGGSGRAEMGTRFTLEPLRVLGLAGCLREVDMTRKDANVARVCMREAVYKEAPMRDQ